VSDFDKECANFPIVIASRLCAKITICKLALSLISLWCVFHMQRNLRRGERHRGAISIKL